MNTIIRKKKLKLQTSWDDYHENNYLLAEVLKRFNIPTIWFIECNGRDKMKQIKDFSDMGFEIGSHTVNHTILNPCDIETQKYEINESKKAIELVIGKQVKWFCYPRGRFTDTTVDLVNEAGYLYARTVRLGNSDFNNPYRLSVDCHCFPRREYNGTDWIDIFKQAIIKYDSVHLWGHMKEIERFGYLPKLEALFRWLKDNYELQ